MDLADIPRELALALLASGRNSRIAVVETSPVPLHSVRVRVGLAQLNRLENTAVLRVQPMDHQVVREHAPECPAVPAQAMSAAQRNRNAVELLEVHIHLRQLL